MISFKLNIPFTIVVYHFESSLDSVKALKTFSFGEFICKSNFIGTILVDL